MSRPYSLSIALSVAVILAGTGTLSVAAQSPAQQSPQQTTALIAEQLDRPIDIQLTSTPLPKVMKQIEEQTGVPIRIRPDVFDILPYGQNTPITATIQNLPLRAALDAIGAKLGLLFVLESQGIEIRPVDALTRLGRRVTVQELKTLDVLQTTPLDFTAFELPLEPTIKQLAAAIDQTLAMRKDSTIVLELRPDAVSTEQRTLRLPRGSTLAVALEEIGRQSTLSWYPWGDSVVVAPRADIYRTLLDRVVNVRYDGVDVSQVLLDLSQRSGVEFTIQPGAIQRVQTENRNVRLLVDAPIRQALESLAGFTGLGYVVNDQGVYIWNDQWTTQMNSSASRGRVVGMIPLPSGMQVFVYDDMLPDDVRKQIDETVKTTIEGMRIVPTPSTESSN